MAADTAEFFGTLPQQEMQRIANALWPLLKGDPRYAYEGRFVGLDRPDLAGVEVLAALAGTQGGTASFFVDAGGENPITSALQARGYTTDRWDHLMAGEAGIAISRDIVDHYSLPTGLKLHEVGRATTEAQMQSFAEMALSCGVLLPAGRALRGETRNSVFYVLLDATGEPVSCSGAVLRNQPGSPFADASWWGMLATREDMRGRGLSLYLGALAMVTMADRFGARRFYTGVRTDNAVSQKLCRRLGLGDHGLTVMAVLDPARFGNTKMTR
ncbi:MAG TPA: GNAT family N-acetyltransferase [Bauldia sp.]